MTAITKVFKDITDGIATSVYAAADLPFWLLAIWTVAGIGLLVATVNA